MIYFPISYPRLWPPLLREMSNRGTVPDAALRLVSPIQPITALLMPPLSGRAPAPQQHLQQSVPASKTFYRGHDLDLAALEPNYSTLLQL